MYDTAIYIGRFEPVHNGHMALLQRALDSARNVIVVMGSAWQARSPKNPFTCHERADMMLEALTETDRARVQVLPMRDYYNEALWVQAVRKGVGQIAAADAHVGLVGHFKDATSSYLSAFPGWELIHVERQGRIDATAIRDAYFGATPGTVRARLSDLASQMPESTLGFLERFAQTRCSSSPAPSTPPLCRKSGACCAATARPGPQRPTRRCLSPWMPSCAARTMCC